MNKRQSIKVMVELEVQAASKNRYGARVTSSRRWPLKL